ncbi:zinc-binding oxidoreductase CipB [Umbelopsis sp. PMI_123]|nr:zinc-binding oxidoreductase CipB [Umbelopsis sp. PMI_123]
MPPSNNGAWQVDKLVKPLQVKTSPYTSPRANEIVVKNHAVAINPVDTALQAKGDVLFTWLTYPTIFGCDLAGEVVEVGSEASRFKVGDRVIGISLGTLPDHNTPAEGAFQNYTVVLASVAAKIPSTLDYAHASVLPLGLGTAASGLFLKEYLDLQLPTEPAQPSTGKTVIIWGGSTSVGSNAIQLAVAAGYEVFSTASPRNFDYLKKLGASQVFDYKDENVVQKIIDALKDKTTAGAMAIGTGSLEPCANILSKTNGSKFVADVMAPTGPNPIPAELGVTSKFVWGSDLKKNEVGKAVFQDFLEKALETGKYIAAPDAEVVGHGLEHIQDAFEALTNGVSAKKIVVTL